MEQGKVCTKCGEWKEFSEFHKKRSAKDGFYPYCKVCKLKDDKKYRENNKEKIKERWKSRYNETKEIKNKKRKEYYHENKEEIKRVRKVWDQRYREKNKELIKERHELWRRNNQDKIKLQQQKWNNSDSFKIVKKRYKLSEKGRNTSYKSTIKRRSLKNKVNFSYYERKQILDRDNWRCQCCGIKVHDKHTGNWNTPDKAHIDHIIPISKGGNSEPDNLQVLCRTCNLSKSDKIESEYITQVN